MTSGRGDFSQPVLCNQPVCPEPIRYGPLQSSVRAGDLDGFCELQAQKKQCEEQMRSRCRKAGEYDPCQNPCARIPGQHPFCPPGQTIGILPEGYVEDIPRPVQKPTSGPPPRLPWKQCVENEQINDQVRRPMARWCHIRPLPPIVVPCSEIDRIRNRITERDRIKEECAAVAAEREAARQASYQRHSEWNYTVDSLLARKREEEERKAKAEEEEFKELEKAIKAGREKYSQEMQARAKQQLLYRKGLIRDFHAAMAYSKTLKEMEEQKKSEFSRPICKFKPSENEECDSNKNSADRLPIQDDPCMKRVIMENNRPEYTKKQVKAECSEERLKLLKYDESRVEERKAELEKEKENLKALRTECPLPWPEPYLKHIQEPAEKKEEDKVKRQQKLKEEILQEIHDKLATDAFIEYQEKEIERQACEYNEYKRKVDKMRKEKEKQLIDEKVERNIKNAEKAAEAFKATKAIQQERTDEYSRLKHIWEAEHAKKDEMIKMRRQGLEQRVTKDFICRKDNAQVKRLELDATREWEKECCLAVQNYEHTCEMENLRREKAKELTKYHSEQVKERTQQKEDERFMNAVYGQKALLNYACEMKEMKDYANAQIQEWKAKGRPIFPLLRAMKKWDYDAGMTPELYSRMPACGQGQDTPSPSPLEPGYESTGQRLGFDTVPGK